jgi:hypothetical protein
VARTNAQQIGVGVYPGLLLILVGLVIAGPWLTSVTARLLARLTGAPAPLLAARRLADTPRAAFRAVSGLVLAVFLGSMLGGLMPTINDTTATPSATALSNVLLDTFTYSPVCGNDVNCTGGNPNKNADSTSGLLGLEPATGNALVQQLQAFHGATVVPYYSLPQDNASAPPGGGLKPGASAPPPQAFYDTAVSCAGLAQLPALGACEPGESAISANTGNLTSDNPKDATEPIAGPADPAVTTDLSTLYLRGVLVKVDNPTTLELVRTFLVTHTPLSQSGMAPRTFGEAVQAREQVGGIVQRIMNIAVVLTLLVAACSLAVATGGGLVERKRPFTLLRLTGTPSRVLYRVVLLEALLPLAAATILAVAAGYGLAVIAATKIAPPGTPIPGPAGSYYLTMAIGLIVAIALISATLPFLNRITRSDNARFE